MLGLATLLRRVVLVPAFVLLALGAGAATSGAADVDHAISAGTPAVSATPDSAATSLPDLADDAALACGALLACAAILLVLSRTAESRRSTWRVTLPASDPPAPARAATHEPRHLYLTGHLTC